MIVPTKRIDAIGSGIPFEDIYSTVFAKPIILPGIADIKIDEIAILAKKSKKALIPLFLKIKFFILLLQKSLIYYKFTYLVTATFKNIA